LDLDQIRFGVSTDTIIKVVSDGNSGIAKAVETVPDLIILDVIMEDFVAGFRVVSELRTGAPDSTYSKYSKVPILMLTSVTSKTNVNFSEKVGTALLPVDAFIEKPVKPGVLISKIEELLQPVV